tara:strand:- start:413 stop:649 length:237 start_codon:yes stop_codon:yes gene_type:complete
MVNNLTNKNIDRIIEMAWEDRTPFSDIKEQFGLLEKDVISIMKDNLKRNSFIKWRKRVRGRKTKIEKISDRFKSKMQK